MIKQRVVLPKAKLWIDDLLRMPKFSLKKETYTFKGKEIKYVDIFGVVVAKWTFRTYAMFSVDDGTGVIPCMINMENPRNMRRKKKATTVSNALSQPNAGGYTPEFVQALKYLMKPVMEYYTDLGSIDIITWGDTVQARGVLTEFKGRREVRTTRMWKVKYLNDEHHRIVEMALIYRNLEKSYEIHQKAELERLEKILRLTEERYATAGKLAEQEPAGTSSKEKEAPIMRGIFINEEADLTKNKDSFEEVNCSEPEDSAKEVLFDLWLAANQDDTFFEDTIKSAKSLTKLEEEGKCVNIEEHCIAESLIKWEEEGKHLKEKVHCVHENLTRCEQDGKHLKTDELCKEKRLTKPEQQGESMKTDEYCTVEKRKREGEHTGEHHTTAESLTKWKQEGKRLKKKQCCVAENITKWEQEGKRLKEEQRCVAENLTKLEQEIKRLQEEQCCIAENLTKWEQEGKSLKEEEHCLSENVMMWEQEEKLFKKEKQCTEENKS